MKNTPFFFAITFSILVVPFLPLPNRTNNIGANASNVSTVSYDLGETMLCSGRVVNFGRCTGSSFCTACSNCSSCKHCSNGGSCGVCAGSYGSSKPKYKSKSSYKKRKRSYSSASRSSGSVSKKTAKAPAIKLETYILTKATSLRALPDAQSKVLKRMEEGDQVKAVDCSDEFWCKVLSGDKKGWVKKHLLKKQ